MGQTEKNEERESFQVNHRIREKWSVGRDECST